MDKDHKLVTIVVTTFNSKLYIKKAIESILAQSYPYIEIIVVDDGSSDDTLNIVRSMGGSLRILTQKNSGGPSKPRNVGIAESSGDYIAFLDPDDVLLPHKIDQHVKTLDKYPYAAMAIGNYQNFSETALSTDHFSRCSTLSSKMSGQQSYLFDPEEALNILINENFFITGSSLYKTSIVKCFSGFDENLLACEDYELTYRIAKHCPIAVHKDVVLMRRFHSGNLTSQTLKMHKYYAQSRLKLSMKEGDSLRRSSLRNIAHRHAKAFLRTSLRKFAVKEILAAISLLSRTSTRRFLIKS